MMRLGEKSEAYVETLNEGQLRALLDRVMRAVADRGYFGDETALNELEDLLEDGGSRGRRAIQAESRLFPDELDERGRRTFISDESPRSGVTTPPETRKYISAEERLREMRR